MASSARRLCLWLCVIHAATLGLVLPARAQVLARHTVASSLLGALFTWIDRHSPYAAARFADDPPKITFCQCGETLQHEGHTIVVHEKLKGLYDRLDHRIVLVEPWDATDLYSVSTLLHELVHYVQQQSKAWSCWPKAEWEAYKLQEAWLKEHGYDPHFNWLNIFLESRCTPPDIHPSLDQRRPGHE